MKRREKRWRKKNLKRNKYEGEKEKQLEFTVYEVLQSHFPKNKITLWVIMKNMGRLKYYSKVSLFRHKVENNCEIDPK